MHATCAIILKREDSRERDERICLYTKDFGKITVIARGIKRIEAKLRGNLDIFNFVDIIFVDGAYFPILTGIDMRERFFEINKNFSIYSSALAIVSIVSDIFEEGARDERFFDKTLNSFRNLDRCAKKAEEESKIYSWAILKKFQLEVLESQGYGEGNTLNIFSKDFKKTEDFFVRSFANYFNYKTPSWLPV